MYQVFFGPSVLFYERNRNTGSRISAFEVNGLTNCIYRHSACYHKPYISCYSQGLNISMGDNICKGFSMHNLK